MGRYKFCFLLLFVVFTLSLAFAFSFLGMRRNTSVVNVSTPISDSLGASHSPMWSYTLDDPPESVAISSDGKYIVVCTTTIYLFDHNRTLLWSYSVGDTVQVFMKRSLGLKATLIAYILPLIILMASLIALTSLRLSELFVGTFTLIFLIPYFYLLYHFRESLKNTFTFRLNKES